MTRKYLWLAVLLVVVVGVGSAIGLLSQPGEWYASLVKPSFNPPNWVFGPVWSLLYVMIAIAGWLVWISRPDSAAMRVWFAQMAFNFLWSPVFFGFQAIGLALFVIGLLLAAIVLFVVLAWKKHRTAAVLFLPYAVWVAFATALNAAILLLN